MEEQPSEGEQELDVPAGDLADLLALLVLASARGEITYINVIARMLGKGTMETVGFVHTNLRDFIVGQGGERWDVQILNESTEVQIRREWIEAHKGYLIKVAEEERMRTDRLRTEVDGRETPEKPRRSRGMGAGIALTPVAGMSDGIDDDDTEGRLY